MFSFVIPAHNEELLIGRTLDALHLSAAAVGEPYELIVADDASTDGTARVAADHGARVVAAGQRQIAATRNRGAAEARGELLIFVDADTIVDETLLRAAVNAWRGGAVGGGCAIRFDGAVPRYARLMMPGFVWVFRMMRVACGCFLFCTRAAFDAVGGFDERNYCAEEVVMSKALRGQGKFIVLRESVLTSGRKLRLHSPWEVLGVMARLTFRPWTMRRKEGLELWYGERRPDPQA